MNKVRQDKVESVARGLLQGKSIRKTLTDEKYSKDTANNGIRNKVVQEAIIRNSTELTKKGLDVKRVIEELLWGITESRRLKTIKDKEERIRLKEALQCHSIYTNVVARHILSTTTELAGDFAPPPIIYNKVEVKEQTPDTVKKHLEEVKSRLT